MANVSCVHLLQGITFKRVGVPTANDIIQSSSKDAMRSEMFRKMNGHADVHTEIHVLM